MNMMSLSYASDVEKGIFGVPDVLTYLHARCLEDPRNDAAVTEEWAEGIRQERRKRLAAAASNTQRVNKERNNEWMLQHSEAAKWEAQARAQVQVQVQVQAAASPVAPR